MGKRAKPVPYTEDIATAICERLSEGESIAAICRTAGMPNRRTVFVWEEDKPEFAQMIDRARKRAAHLLASELIELVDAPAPTFVDEKGRTRTDGAAIQLRRLKFDARRWIIAKMLPKVYGDHLKISGDPEAPLVMQSDSLEVAKQVSFLLRNAERQEADEKAKEAAPTDVQPIAIQQLPQAPQPVPIAQPVVERVEHVQVEDPPPPPPRDRLPPGYRPPIKRKLPFAGRLHPMAEGGGWGPERERPPELEEHERDGGGHGETLIG